MNAESGRLRRPFFGACTFIHHDARILLHHTEVLDYVEGTQITAFRYSPYASHIKDDLFGYIECTQITTLGNNPYGSLIKADLPGYVKLNCYA